MPDEVITPEKWAAITQQTTPPGAAVNAPTPEAPPMQPGSPDQAAFADAPPPMPEDIEAMEEDHLDIAVSDTSENPPVEFLKDGATVLAKIFSVSKRVGKKPPFRGMLEIILEAAEFPAVDVIRDYPNLPFAGSPEHKVQPDSELQRRKKIQAIREFYQCFKIKDRMKYEDMRGLQGWVSVTVEDSPDFGMTQRVKAYLAPPTTGVAK
jgi:hypothetical protein